MKKDYRFFSLQEIVYVHREQVIRFGGALGIRDIKLLESAAHGVAATFDGHYLHKDVFEMAAAYAYGIIKNHPFVDGNKRTGMAVALLFLEVNGFSVETPVQDLYELAVSMATSKISLSEVAVFFRSRLLG